MTTINSVSRRVMDMIAEHGQSMPDYFSRIKMLEYQDCAIEWDGPGFYGLIRRCGEQFPHLNIVSEEMFLDWMRNEWDSCNNRSARDGWLAAGWMDMQEIINEPE